MVRRIFMLVITGLFLGVSSLRSTAEIVVLTDKPVAEFTLPDGTVLTNAFAWRRTSEGMMIVHDNGQYYLNFMTLPDDWRKAYAVFDEVKQVRPVAAKRYDQYNVYPVLERIAGLSNKAVTFFESEEYDGKADDILLSACALQDVLDGRIQKATHLYELLGKAFPDYEPTALDSFFKPCEACKGAGMFINRCPVCKGSGKCPRCNGTGERSSNLINEPAISCTACRGTGKCPKCGGTGKLSMECPKCKGSGKVLKQDELKASLDELVQQLNKFHADHSE